MQARALVRGISMSPRKMRVVANLVRGKKVEEAVGLLDLMPKKAAGIISKAIKSAAANAEDKSGGDASVEDLRIHTIAVDGGTIAQALDAALDGSREPHQPPHVAPHGRRHGREGVGRPWVRKHIRPASASASSRRGRLAGTRRRTTPSGCMKT